MKKVLVYVFLFLTLIILAGSFFLLNYNKRYKENDAIKGVPVNAAIIIRISDISKFSNLLQKDIDYKAELQQFSLPSKVYEFITELDTLCLLNNTSLKILKHKQLITSFHIQGKNEIKTLLTTTSESKAEENRIISAIKDLTSKDFTVTSRSYDAATIYSVDKENKQTPFYISVFNGIILGSHSELLIESAIRQIQSELSLLTNSSFAKVYKTSGKSNPANLYINFSALPHFLSTVFKDAKKIPSIFKTNNDLWAELDVDIKSKEIEMNGFIAGERSSMINELFTGMKPEKPQIFNILPSNTRIYMSYCMETSEEFQKRFHSYLKKSGKSTSYWKNINTYKKKYHIDPDAEIFSIIEDEMALVFADIDKTNHLENSFLIAETKGKSFALDKIKKIMKAFGYNSLQPYENYKVDEEISFPIYKSIPQNIPGQILDWFFPVVPQKYFSFFDNYIIFSNNVKSLHDFLYANVLKKTLTNKKHFIDFIENFPVRKNLFIYSEIPVLALYLKSILKDQYVNFSKEQITELSKFYAGGLQITSTGNMLYTNIYANYLPSRENEPHTIWQSLLDSTVINKPVLVRNHYTNEKELLVQDAKFNLYLLNNSGRLLWKKPLDGKILETVEQIDYYRNNKLQYLFNTKNKIYLIDRNGNSVDKYPITLPSKATNGLAVMDYDNNRNYRIFLATNDRKIRLYDKHGNSITGWKFRQTEGTTTQPVQHFRSNSKDYIIFSDDHKIYILNRRGNIRVKPNKHITAATNCKLYIKGANTPDCKLITASPKGELISIDIPTGKTNIKKVIDETKEFAFTYFEQRHRSKYLFLLPGKLKIFDTTGRETVSKTFNKRMSLTIDKYKFSSDNFKFGFLEQSKEHIYLVNSDGSTYKGFPLRGSSRFSIGFLKSSSSRFNLVVGGDNNYIYNYRVE